MHILSPVTVGMSRDVAAILSTRLLTPNSEQLLEVLMMRRRNRRLLAMMGANSRLCCYH